MPDTIIACCSRCNLIEERDDDRYGRDILQGWIQDHAARHGAVKPRDNRPGR